MKNFEDKASIRELQDNIYAVIWLLFTFVSLPYFLVALNMEPSQFFLLDSLFVNVHPGIHHGLYGYITLSLGLLGMRSSTHIEEDTLRNYLFLISFLFLIDGLYLSIHDLAYEQIFHTGVEHVYIWSWEAPRAQIFPLIAFIPLLWMENSKKLFMMMIPLFLLSIFFTPYIVVVLGYLVTIFITSRQDIETSWMLRKHDNWELITKTSWIVGVSLMIIIIILLIGIW